MPQYGRLELTEVVNEGPPNGLTLDAAIDRLIQVNPDLLSKARELPKARADTVTAGLLANPIVFFSADMIPYGSYSNQRPGNNSYGIVLVQPLDINHKRRNRVIVAEQARSVLEAQYADAVRMAIDQLATAFVNAIEAREVLRYKQANVNRLAKMVEVTQKLLSRSAAVRPDLDRMAILRDTAEIELDASRSTLIQTLRALAVLLQIPECDADALMLRGTIRDAVPPPPPVNELVKLAVLNRPDVVAYRRGVGRARPRSTSPAASGSRTSSCSIPLTVSTTTPTRASRAPPAGASAGWSRSRCSTATRGTSPAPRRELFRRRSSFWASSARPPPRSDAPRSTTRPPVARSIGSRETSSPARNASAIRPTASSPRGNRRSPTTSTPSADYYDIVRRYYDSMIRHRRSMIRLNTAVGHRILP